MKQIYKIWNFKSIKILCFFFISGAKVEGEIVVICWGLKC